ncbi:hypothetical protein [Stutzerimonas tarimensis]|uniref:Uncharacterized protein n=1 Tax=Stutzerimonas tarimensis TaxID=1507735 RepID=A0ABV7TDD6_9GAMM
MGDPRDRKDAHSSEVEASKRRLRWRFFAALVLIGFLLGLMLGRLVSPDPARLLEISEGPAGLLLRFDREPALQAGHEQGLFGLRLQAEGAAAEGQMRLDEGALVNWRLRPAEEGLALVFIAVRPLRGEWRGQAEGQHWQLEVRVTLE